MAYKKVRKKIDIWADREYVDLWTVVHFLAGVVLGFVPFIVPFAFWQVFWSVLVLLVLWEVYEYVSAISETIWNRIMDVLIAVLGFGITVFTVPLVSTPIAIISAALLMLVYAGMNIMGWHAYKKRKTK